MNHLLENCKVTVVQAPLADGQSDPDSARVDMSGWDGVVFLCTMGAITGAGTCTMVAKQATTDIVGAALSGASVVASTSADSDMVIGIDIYRPTKRYLGVSLTRETAGSVVGGVLAIQYRGRSAPVTQPTASWAAPLVTLVTPAEP